MTLPETASFSEFADLRGYKRSYITELKKQRRLVLTEDGKRILVAESIDLIRDTSDPSKIGVARRHAATRASTPAETGPGPGSVPASRDEAAEAEDKADAPFHSNRAEREHWLALSAKRDYELSIGKLMDAADVEAAVAQAAVSLRKAMERLPDILAPQIAPITDESKIRALLAESIEIALLELSQQFGAIGKRAAV